MQLHRDRQSFYRLGMGADKTMFLESRTTPNSGSPSPTDLTRRQVIYTFAKKSCPNSLGEAQRDAVAVVPEDHLGEALVADPGFRQHPGGAGLHGFLAARAVLLLQPVEEALRLSGLAVEDGAVPKA